MSDPQSGSGTGPAPSFQVRIPLEWDETAEMPTVYANQVLVSHTGPEFFIVFGFVAPPLNTGELPDVVKIHPQVRVVVAREAMPAIVQALGDNLRRQREGQGRPPEAGPAR